MRRICHPSYGAHARRPAVAAMGGGFVQPRRAACLDRGLFPARDLRHKGAGNSGELEGTMLSTLSSASAPAREERAEPLALRPLSPALGVEVMEVDLAKLDDPGFDRIYDAFLEHQMLLFRDQQLTPGEQVIFARRFGSVQVHVMNQYHAEGFPEIYYLSNLDASGRPSGKHPDKGTVHWHTDGSWARRTGQATLLYADQVPSAGGETRFASM
jgi:taurine dioxygenase